MTIRVASIAIRVASIAIRVASIAIRGTCMRMYVYVHICCYNSKFECVVHVHVSTSTRVV